jgi:eukaryotic-like serine/threonine-protein kinase
MSFTAGAKLGPYEILAPIGAGGMGEVYRARDTKLDRNVAIKVLPSALAQDPERLARFEREAKVLAALNHPNIAQIYGVEQGALVMELVEGENLSGPVPLATVLDYARQIADALEAAHEKGIVHRDLKPANIKVTPQGVVKVLDFGLAGVVQSSAVPDANATQSPTLTLPATQMGVLLGTAAYMSPEQARGKPVDKRADIWAFGVVFYEMATGRQLFHGDDITSTLAAVVLKEPDLGAAPPPIRRVLRRCLEKDPKKRLRDISGVELLLEEAQEPPPAQVPGPWRMRFRVSATAATLFLVAAGLMTLLYLRELHKALHTLRYTIPAPEKSRVQSIAASPDGRHVVIASAVNGKRQLWLRPLDSLQAQPLPFPEGATYPFWSPDSRYIGFFAQGKLKKIAIDGGPAVTLCDAVNGRGGSWSKENVILFSPGIFSGIAALQRVPGAGGTPTNMISSKNSSPYPAFLPDGRHFLFSVSVGYVDPPGIYFASLDGKEKRRILPDQSSVVFAAGFLLFVRENILMAQRFDATNGQTLGEPRPVAQGVLRTANDIYAPVTASENGVLKYEPLFGAGGNQMAWYDRAGKLMDTVGPRGPVWEPAISPDEKTVAFRRGSASGVGTDIWLRDLVRGSEQRVTTDPSTTKVAPFWSPRGDYLVFN